MSRPNSPYYTSTPELHGLKEESHTFGMGFSQSGSELRTSSALTLPDFPCPPTGRHRRLEAYCVGGIRFTPSNDQSSEYSTTASSIDSCTSTPFGKQPEEHPPFCGRVPVTPLLRQLHLGDEYDYVRPAIGELTPDEIIDKFAETNYRYRLHLRERSMSYRPQIVGTDHIIKCCVPAMIQHVNHRGFEMYSTPLRRLENDFLVVCYGDLEGEWRTTKYRKEKGDYVFWLWMNHEARQRTVVRVKRHHVRPDAFPVKVAKVSKAARLTSRLVGIQTNVSVRDRTHIILSRQGVCVQTPPETNQVFEIWLRVRILGQIKPASVRELRVSRNAWAPGTRPVGTPVNFLWFCGHCMEAAMLEWETNDQRVCKCSVEAKVCIVSRVARRYASEKLTTAACLAQVGTRVTGFQDPLVVEARISGSDTLSPPVVDARARLSIPHLLNPVVNGSGEGKPHMKWSDLIRLAFLHSDSGALTLSGVYRFLINHFPWFQKNLTERRCKAESGTMHSDVLQTHSPPTESLSSHLARKATVAAYGVLIIRVARAKYEAIG
ncbi:hypothetical protein C8R47DRAFT_1065325 [Mycena vitilis]|nr:hypothetical protein C8R47DRAFT_1065325 [Mycena vitilis]